MSEAQLVLMLLGFAAFFWWLWRLAYTAAVHIPRFGAMVAMLAGAFMCLLCMSVCIFGVATIAYQALAR